MAQGASTRQMASQACESVCQPRHVDSAAQAFAAHSVPHDGFAAPAAFVPSGEGASGPGGRDHRLESGADDRSRAGMSERPASAPAPAIAAPAAQAVAPTLADGWVRSVLQLASPPAAPAAPDPGSDAGTSRAAGRYTSESGADDRAATARIQQRAAAARMAHESRLQRTTGAQGATGGAPRESFLTAAASRFVAAASQRSFATAPFAPTRPTLAGTPFAPPRSPGAPLGVRVETSMRAGVYGGSADRADVAGMPGKHRAQPAMSASAVRPTGVSQTGRARLHSVCSHPASERMEDGFFALLVSTVVARVRAVAHATCPNSLLFCVPADASGKPMLPEVIDPPPTRPPTFASSSQPRRHASPALAPALEGQLHALAATEA